MEFEGIQNVWRQSIIKMNLHSGKKKLSLGMPQKKWFDNIKTDRSCMMWILNTELFYFPP
jgi:hypothetical protein